jgi:hypothetical protein
LEGKKHEILNNIAYICIFVIYPEALLSTGDQYNENSRSQKIPIHSMT